MGWRGWLVSLPVVGLGCLAIVAGELDDSPGLQGIGLLILVGLGVWIFGRRR